MLLLQYEVLFIENPVPLLEQTNHPRPSAFPENAKSFLALHIVRAAMRSSHAADITNNSFVC